MKITVEFNSIEEFNLYFSKDAELCIEVPKKVVATAEVPEPEKTEPAVAPVEAPKTEKATKDTPKPKKSKDEAKAKPSVDPTDLKMFFHQKIRVENKRKEAKELLNEFEVGSVTELIENYPEKIDALYARAKEVL